MVPAQNKIELTDNYLEAALEIAIRKAEEYHGATAPNPPVGAVCLSAAGEILALSAHEKAGTPHAEAKAIAECIERGMANKVHTLVITLEPCNHFGRTPPCTEAIIRLAAEGNLKRVAFGVSDPNPKVAGRGADRLKSVGLEVIDMANAKAKELIAPFRHSITSGTPWVTLKRAFDAQGSMIPPLGAKTFSSPEALKFAHELRKQADAILTGSGTVLADLPEFTVRHVKDHPQKIRWLVVLDKRSRVPTSWISEREANGFNCHISNTPEEALRFLGEQGVMEVLVEAGPKVSEYFLSNNLWNKDVKITPAGIDVQLR
jgi:diaminohydroxyphosphoribosylaminopyrimidine deaminase/5-amino-6-(5-phosphoribosylamino)uracil reductase